MTAQLSNVTVFLDIKGGPVPVGKMKIVEDGRASKAYFRYGSSWLAGDKSFPLDPVQLPLKDATFETPADFFVFNGIRDAAPDRWGRSVIDHFVMATKNRPATESEMLLTSQRGQRFGAITYGRDIKRPGPVTDISMPLLNVTHTELTDLLAAVDLINKGDAIPDDLMPLLGPQTDMGGGRPKATITCSGRPYMIKTDLKEDRYAVSRVEAGCLDLCERLGLPVPKRDVISLGERDALIIERFDRELGEVGRPNQQTSRKHVISAMTLLGAHEQDRHAHGYADVYDALRRFGTRSGPEGQRGREIWKRMVANVLIGNTDDHYRNHAFIATNRGFEMAPVYDVTPTLQLSSHRRGFLHLGRADGNPDGATHDLNAAINQAEHFGMTRGEAAIEAEKMAGIVRNNWEKIMISRGVSQSDRAKISNSFSQAHTEIEHREESVPERRMA